MNMIRPVSWDGNNNLVVRIFFDEKSFVIESTANDGVSANIIVEPAYCWKSWYT